MLPRSRQPHPPPATLFPYTTLFRSAWPRSAGARRHTRPRDGIQPVHALFAARSCAEHGHHGARIARGSAVVRPPRGARSEEHTSELQSRFDIVCRLLLDKKMSLNID